MTDFFPIRRSNRKTKSELKVCCFFFKKNSHYNHASFNFCTRLTQFSNCQQSEEHRHLDDMIKSGTEEGLRVIYAFKTLFVLTFLHVVICDTQVDAGKQTKLELPPSQISELHRDLKNLSVLFIFSSTWNLVCWFWMFTGQTHRRKRKRGVCSQWLPEGRFCCGVPW